MQTHNATRRKRIATHRIEGMARRATTLKRYATFRPTPFDGHLKAVGEFANMEAWYIAPVSVTRDSDVLDRANWEALKERLRKADPSGFHHEEHTFGHWGPGWFSLMLVRPRSLCWRIACDIAYDLEDYPIVDEDLFASMEHEEAYENTTGHTIAEDIDTHLNERSLEYVREHGNIAWANAHLQCDGVVDGLYRYNGSNRDSVANALWELRKDVRNGR
jgi:hypothetical protein